MNALSSLATPPELLSPRFINLAPGSGSNGPTNEVDELTAGLVQLHASVSPKYFYDVLGSKLFEAITALSEYYPTRVEASIFESAHGDRKSVV